MSTNNLHIPIFIDNKDTGKYVIMNRYAKTMDEMDEIIDNDDNIKQIRKELKDKYVGPAFIFELEVLPNRSINILTRRKNTYKSPISDGMIAQIKQK